MHREGTPTWATVSGGVLNRSKLDGATFEQCALVRCRFSGPLRRVTFDGRTLPDRCAPQPLEDVDLTEAVFDEVDFMGLLLDRVALPQDPDLRLVHGFRGVSERALLLLDGDQSREARMLRGELENRLRMMRTDVQDNVLNRRDYAASGGSAFPDQALDLVCRAEPPSPTPH